MYEKFITSNVDSSWHKILHNALSSMDQDYLADLSEQQDWLPGIENIFNAFSLPLNRVHYILFGESPYPRAESANGYAFWDAAVDDIWSPTGLSKPVNRATSLRNIIKMLLVAEQQLKPDKTDQPSISNINKSSYINKLSDLFNNLHNNGVLLLNATLALRKGKVKQDSRYWLAFVASLLSQLSDKAITLILFGKIAQVIDNLPEAENFNRIYAEHPYNLSFINNPKVISLFKQFKLLNC